MESLVVVDERLIGERFRALAPELTERGRRIWAASEARAIGRGGIAAVARASGIAPNTIAKGIREIEADERLEGGRVRRLGAGRKPISQTDPELLDVLEALVAEDCRASTVSRGKPIAATCASQRPANYWSRRARSRATMQCSRPSTRCSRAETCRSGGIASWRGTRTTPDSASRE